LKRAKVVFFIRKAKPINPKVPDTLFGTIVWLMSLNVYWGSEPTSQFPEAERWIEKIGIGSAVLKMPNQCWGWVST
jgi:hypothetical protein